MVDLNILIGGQAGQGIEFTADIISKYSLSWDIMYIIIDGI